MAARLQPDFQEDIRVSRMNDDMTPKNELEKRILGVQGEQISIDDFMHTRADLPGRKIPHAYAIVSP